MITWSNNSNFLVSFKDTITTLQTTSLLDFCAESEMNRPIVKDAPSLPLPDEATLTTYLDHVLVLSKRFNFEVLLCDLGPRLRLRPTYWYKNFPKKFFSSFSPKGHSYYLGDNGTYDIHILFQPRNGDCSCTPNSNEKTAVDQETANMVKEELVIGLLRLLPDHVLHGFNLVIEGSDSNFGDANSWTLDFFHFQTMDMNAQMKGLWDRIPRGKYSAKVDQFIANHEPRLSFNNYGQNTELSIHNAVELICGVFNLNHADLLTLSLAVNVSNPNFSVTLTEENCQTFFARKQDVTVYRKGFHKQFVNFSCSHNYPRSLNQFNLETPGVFKRSVVGFHGYSDVANVLRRSDAREPYSQRPVASLFALRPPFSVSTEKGFKEKVESQVEDLLKLQNDIKTGITAKCRTGSSYRFEATFTYELESSNVFLPIQQDLSQLERDFKQWVKDNCFEKLSIVKTKYFPKIVRVYTDSIFTAVNEKITLLLNQPLTITPWDKEYMAFAECLLRFCINGNSRNISHSLFRSLGISRSITLYNFPYYPEANYDVTERRFHPTLEFVTSSSITLLDQQSGVLVSDRKKVKASAFQMKVQAEQEVDESIVQEYFSELLEILQEDIHTLIQNRLKNNTLGVTSATETSLSRTARTQLLSHTPDMVLLLLNRWHNTMQKKESISHSEILNTFFCLESTPTALPTTVFEKNKNLYFLESLYWFKYFLIGSNQEQRLLWVAKNEFSQWIGSLNFFPCLNSKGWTGSILPLTIQAQKKFKDGRSSRNQRPDLQLVNNSKQSLRPTGDKWILEFESNFKKQFVETWNLLGTNKEFPCNDLRDCRNGLKTLILLSMVGSTLQIKLTTLTQPKLLSAWAACFFVYGMYHLGNITKAQYDTVAKKVQYNKVTLKLVSKTLVDWSTLDKKWLTIEKMSNSDTFEEDLFAAVLKTY